MPGADAEESNTGKVDTGDDGDAEDHAGFLTENEFDVMAEEQTGVLPDGSQLPILLDANPTIPLAPVADILDASAPKSQAKAPNPEEYSLGGFSIPELQQQLDHTVSWDILKYDLATTDNLEREPALDPSQFEPSTGVQFNDDGAVTIKVLTGDRNERLTLIGDFNQWGQGVDLEPYRLEPTAANPEIQAVTLPPGNYHLMQYRLVDQNGNQRLHLSADVFSTPAFNARFYDGDRRQDTLNAVIYLWFTREIIRSRTEIDIWKLDTILNLDWPRALVYYSGNHDEFANPGNPFQARGRYLVQSIDGGDFHNQKVRSWSAMAMFAGSYFLDMFQQWTLQWGGFSTNAPIEWHRLDDPATARIVAFQSDLKKFFQSEPAFAPYNIHRHMVHWIDNVNKVITYERINFETGKRVYVTVNLADQTISDYTVPVYPEQGTYQIALDTDRTIYGGQDRNPATVEIGDRALSFYLDSYGVVALVEQ